MSILLLDRADANFLVYVIILLTFGLVLNLTFSTPVSAGSVTTEAVTVNGTTNCVTFHGTGTSVNYVWFEYGSAESETGYKTFATKNQTSAGGSFADSRCGLPLFPGKSYNVQAAGNDGTGLVYGTNVSFVYATITPHVTVTYEQQLDIMLNEGGIDSPFINGQKILTTDIWQVYVEVMGSLFFGLLVAFIFFNITIKQRTVVMAFLLTILTGTTLWAFMPDEFVFMAQSMTIIAISGLLFWLFMKRK